MKPYAVLFDMDGVLIDSYEAHFEAWTESCAQRGIQLTRERYARLFGQSFLSFVEDLCPAAPGTAGGFSGKTSLTEAAVEQWHDEKELLYRSRIRRAFPEMAGAGDLIRDLFQAGFVLGIASSGPRENVDCLLEHLPHAGCIRFTISATEARRAKPDPEPYLKCAQGLGIAAERCAVVEDSIHGLQAARSAGMRAVALTGTATAGELSRYADRVITRLADLNAEDLRRFIDRNNP